MPLVHLPAGARSDQVSDVLEREGWDLEETSPTIPYEDAVRMGK